MRETPKLTVRVIRFMPIVTMFAGCTCWGNPATTPIAVSTDARRALCERYIAVLAGRQKDLALLDKPEVRALPGPPPDLVMCGAVASDSDALCRRVMPRGRGPSMACRHTVSIFHELRTYPKSHSFLFDDIDREESCGMRSLQTFCDTFRQVLRSGDATECARTGDGESLCHAYMNLDRSLCRLQGNLAALEVEAPKDKENEPRKRTIEFVFEENCKRNIDSRAFLAQGLKTLAESGPQRERELAKAARGQADACSSYAQTAMQSCMGDAPTR